LFSFSCHVFGMLDFLSFRLKKSILCFSFG
jgi:hypothetical protein